MTVARQYERKCRGPPSNSARPCPKLRQGLPGKCASAALLIRILAESTAFPEFLSLQAKRMPPVPWPPPRPVPDGSHLAPTAVSSRAPSDSGPHGFGPPWLRASFRSAPHDPLLQHSPPSPTPPVRLVPSLPARTNGANRLTARASLARMALPAQPTPLDDH